MDQTNVATENQQLKSKVAALEELLKEYEQTSIKQADQLDKRIGELEQMNNFMTGREVKMVELKKRISELENKTETKTEI